MGTHNLFLDRRQKGGCAYCGSKPDTRDHVPSKILLDDPLPLDLPVVAACSACNSGFSLDEEYLACLLECTLCGTTSPSGLRRKKVRRSLKKNPTLAKRLHDCMRADDAGRLIWQPEMDRVRNIIVKLARGHAAYELYSQLDEPDEVDFAPFLAMSDDEKIAFQSARHVTPQGWPEIGSRAFLRACGESPDPHQRGGWIVVQPGRYRYSVQETGGVFVGMVLSEYLFCTVRWE